MLAAGDGAGLWSIDGAADPDGAADGAAWVAAGPDVDPGGYVQAGLAVAGAQAATPTATRPLPATASKDRRLMPALWYGASVSGSIEG